MELGLYPFLQAKEPFKDLVSIEVRGKRLLRKWFCFCFTISRRLKSVLSDAARSGPRHRLSRSLTIRSVAPQVPAIAVFLQRLNPPTSFCPGPCSCSFLYLKHLSRRSFPSSVLAVIQISAQPSLLNNALPLHSIQYNYNNFSQENV